MDSAGAFHPLGATTPLFYNIYRWRLDLYNLLDRPSTRTAYSYHIAVFLYILLLLSFIPLAVEEGPWMILLTQVMEGLLAAYFVLELVVRLWAVGADAKYVGISGRLHYIRRPVSIMDILILAATILLAMDTKWNISSPLSMDKLRFVQMLRLFHIDRQMANWKLIQRMLRRSRFELLSAYYLALVVMALLAVSVYTIEEGGPTFTTYGEAFWLSLVSVLSIGYGDIVPKRPGAKVAVCLLAYVGLVLFSAASGLIGVGMTLMLSDQNKRRRQGKLREMAAKLIQVSYRFRLASRERCFRRMLFYRRCCGKLRQVEERIRSGRVQPSTYVERRQPQPELPSINQALSTLFHSTTIVPMTSITRTHSSSTTSSTSSGFDESLSGHYRWIFRMCYFFMFITLRRKFNRARKPYELMDAENEIWEMEQVRAQKLKELDYRLEEALGWRDAKEKEEHASEEQSTAQPLQQRMEICEQRLESMNGQMDALEQLNTLTLNELEVLFNI